MQQLVSRLSSEFNSWYLDDGILAGNPETVLADFEKIISEQDLFGLKVNIKKCELSILGSNCARNDAVISSFLNCRSDLKLVPVEDINLLGAPLFEKGIDNELSSRFLCFKLMCSRLVKLDHHDALFLLKNAFFIPKLLYTLRSFPCHGNRFLKDLDSCMKVCLESTV